MSQPLISAGSLIRGAWNDARKHMQATSKIILWMWIIMSAYYVVLYLLFPGMNPNSINAADVESLSGYSMWSSLLMLVILVPILWLGVRMSRLVLALDKNQTPSPNEASEAWGYILPMLWISVLVGLAVTIGFILLIIPGIWLCIALSFSSYLMLEDNLRGVAALKASRALTKGRWWGILWRMFAPIFVFSLGLGIIVGILTGVLSAVGLPWIIVNIVINALTYFFFVPIEMFIIVKLFHSLKQTQTAEPAAPVAAPAAPAV